MNTSDPHEVGQSSERLFRFSRRDVLKAKVGAAVTLYGLIKTGHDPIAGLAHYVAEKIVHADDAKKDSTVPATPNLGAAVLPTPEVVLNDIATRMKADLTPYTPVNPDEVYAAMQQKKAENPDTYSGLFGEQISVGDSMRYFYIAGFRGNDLKRMTAISRRESGGYPGAVGDWNYLNSGSLSIGSTQIRCITEGSELPCVGPRDWRTNFDPMTSAVHTYELAYNGRAAELADTGDSIITDMAYDGRFHPWIRKDTPEKPDPALHEFMPDVEATFQAFQGAYGNLTV